MPRKKRSRQFMLDPAAYLMDPAVLAMTLEERGAYSTLFMAMWDLKEPGVVEAKDQVLAVLARASMDEWTRVKNAVAGAFDTVSRPGYWILGRMVAEHRYQTRLSRQKSDAGRESGRVRRLRQPKAPGGGRSGKTKDASAVGAEQVFNTRSTDVEQTGEQVLNPPPLPLPPPLREEEEPRGPTAVRAVVQQILGGLGSPEVQSDPSVKGGFDSATVDAKLRMRGLVGGNLKRFFQLAGWFWKTGTHDMQVLLALLDHAIKHQPENWFAYYAPEGEARLAIECKARELINAQKKREWNEADVKLLGLPPRASA